MVVRMKMVGSMAVVRSILILMVLSNGIHLQIKSTTFGYPNKSLSKFFMKSATGSKYF